jgi:GntR family transcriptional regulator, transcriptional repressor for pyruvate dehydrogenase complex
MRRITLNRLTLADQVAQALIDYIDAEQLKPGDTLPSIGKLADEFGVSKPIVREALKALEGGEIIEISNGRTPIVKPISSKSLRLFFRRAVSVDQRSMIELLEIRRGLEIQSALLAAKNRTAAEAERMQALVLDMRDKLYDPAPYAVLDLELHLLIASASRNSLMFHLIESIRDVLKSTIEEGLRSRFTEEQTIRVQHLHEDIVAALINENVEAASQAMARHFDDAIDAVYHSMLAPGNSSSASSGQVER